MHTPKTINNTKHYKSSAHNTINKPTTKTKLNKHKSRNQSTT